MQTQTKERVWMSSPHMSGREMEMVADAFATNWIAPLGPHVDAFERELADYCGTKGAVVLSSGTAAIHLALITLDVQPGDYVICQSFTFAATANPIVYLGATPVFIESEPDTWNMCPKALEMALITLPRKPKAILPVHLYGMPAKMEHIRLIASAHGVPILEDAAEALGSTIDGKRCGSFGQMGILSFNGNKIITTSGGGALVSDDLDALSHVRFLSTQARDKAPHYQHSQIGYNYRMSNVLAGIGRAQLDVLPDRITARRNHFEAYQRAFSSIEGISMPMEPDGYFSNRWLSTIVVDPTLTSGVTREDIRLALESENIESRPLWKPMHMQPVFQGAPYFVAPDSITVSEHLFEHGLCLPSGSNMSAETHERITKIISKLIVV
jgi:dTDP-4-amino-4,6-dideoxygalactose transaminase